MSDVKKRMGTPADLDKSGGDGRVKKMKFTPPVLHNHGKVVEISKGGPNAPDPNDLEYFGAVS
jgi:hypothetical protein